MTSREHPLPGFVELAELGAGAQGEVVLARHESGGGPVAIKYLAADLLHDTTARNTFRDEAEMLKRVTDPHVARLLDYLESPWGAAIILEAVAGRPLRKVLDEHEGPLTPEAALATLKGSLLGLAAAHSVGVVHRDYKPANVLVQDDGQSKLIDFGVAVLTGQGGQAGTPAYMSPEQWAGEPATPATDLYAATCVFVECVTGEKPFGGTTLAELKTAHAEGSAPLEKVPEPLRSLVQRGLAKRPSERVWNAYEFVSQLEAAAVRTYGPDWERRGILALGAVAATVATAVPLAMLGGALFAPGASAGAAVSTAAGHASMGFAQGATSADVLAKTGASASKGFLSKVGGAKGAAAIGAVGTGAAVAAWLFWPGPTVGGTSRAGVHAHFTKPGVLLGQANLPVAETPYIDLKYSLAPARAKTGTEVHLEESFHARTPAAIHYTPTGERQCLGEKVGGSKTHWYQWGIGLGKDQIDLKTSDYLAFYRIPPFKRGEIPQKAGDAITLPVISDTTGEQQPYVPAECATMSQWTTKYRIVLPEHKLLPPGKYLVTPHAPMKVTTAIRDDVAIPPESAGARIDGTLPVIEVLGG
ncbi:serine/threonine protein kinase [Actinomadura darangshiensis]|uniref:Serine/threonine protein kinase n=1 Tax=Actinomadura darangshiensis TaxID=705336 RepID=A0A4R5AL20_9ACTN|nr:serine/threonine-protein kinase [Actinomadura darangshiensis]TDD72159.1 serine/threonine protein kinase [Actinomadura darangshiensis]